jgi:hypothetical protein
MARRVGVFSLALLAALVAACAGPTPPSQPPVVTSTTTPTQPPGGSADPLAASKPATAVPSTALDTTSSPSIAPSPSICLTSWSSKATTSDVTRYGPRMIMWSFGGWPAGGDMTPKPPSERGLFLSLLEPVSSLPGLTVAPFAPPFRTPNGTAVKLAGAVFLKVVLDGVTGHEGVYNTDVVAASVRPPPKGIGQQFVEAPVLELRRLARIGSKETWIVGLDGPVCLRPLLFHQDITQEQIPGDNVLFLELDPAGG